ncbi:13E12 repeat family protein [Tenggerimyces flavus]|uniref:DUF222 domain-containing protein n=1 Tax=Tenggerimyces flavus TaxID=1708749 RepID=A0ABV7Y2H6_9ACTN|nr:hypothetical protein [Tenggerimyces flavus]MBM7790697.1 hypothetical protein [Tenggerimyces flavus]
MFDTLTSSEALQLAAVCGKDRADCSGVELEDRLRARERMKAWLDAESLADVEALAHTAPGPEDGPPRRTDRWDPFIGDVVASALSWTRYAGETFAGLAAQLVDLPGTRVALAAGRIDLAKAKVLAAGVAVLADPLDRQKVENAVLGRAETRTTGWLRAEVAAQVVRINPDAARERHERRVAERGVDFFPDEDSTATIRVYGLPVDEVAEAEAYLRSCVDTRKAMGDERSRPQLRADLASAMLRGKPLDEATTVSPLTEVPDVTIEGRRRNGPKLVLTAPITTLLDLGTRPATLAGYGPVVTEIARQLTAKLAGDPDATACWAATDPVTGQVVHTGRVSTRYFRGLLDEHVKIRDGHCRFPNCRHPAMVCRGDHTTNHADNGPTCACNAGALCAHHDLVKQSGTWTMRQPEPGHFEWTDPHGREYVVEPVQLTDPDPPPF